MISKLTIAGVFLSLWFATAVRAQSTASVNKLIVSLPDGGFVSFQNQSAWTDIRQAFRLRQLPPALGSQALTDRNQTIHRILRDPDGRFVFGYDLWVSGDVAAKRFKVAVRPLDAELETSLRGNQTAAGESSSTFPKATDAQILNDGAEFSVDLLINKNTGVKIIDVVKVSFDARRLGGENPGVRARDFSLDAVAMEMRDYSLLVNDQLIATGKSKTGSTGALLWIYIPGRGRFIFSLVARADYPFQKAGTVAANRIEFNLNGDHYLWLSSSPILREEGPWNLWVLPDPHYVPLMGSRVDPPPQEKGTLEKIDQTISSIGQKSPVTVSKPGMALQPQILNRMEQDKEKLRERSERIMFGAADRIENLLPRN
jgi:hypothetical protein